MDNTHVNQSLVVFVLGTTGVGKSKLAIELAKEYNGEIISSDSMQLYKDAGDITTNKVTTEEMQGVPHHMMSYLPMDTLNYNVGDFTLKAIEVVGKLPIVVGGTHYYTCSLLWSNSIISYDNDTPKVNDSSNDIENLDKEKYSFEKLKEIDSVMAEKIHKNDIRKIKRSLDIFYSTGKKQSDIINTQFESKKLRYRSCLLWLECKDQQLLETRLNTRVDEMIERGLIEEVFNIFKHPSITQVTTENFTKGVTQAIGIKELYNYYVLLNQYNQNEKEFKSKYNIISNNITGTTTSLISSNDTNSSATTPTIDKEKLKDEKKLKKEKEQLNKELFNAISEIKSHTKRYAIRQVKWISKLSPENQLEILKLDSSDLAKWNDNVFQVSKNYLESFLTNSNLNAFNINSNNNNDNNNNNKINNNDSDVLFY
ncbi:hypothetical protein DICPUDRAFT_151185 [Dictyostelium purpureum]|uniref:tRNA isopentenyltransferase n=1 Tax=Dictyostelium purpureum TaxID=5786 RepID=F0ZI76_DICPU|nr:uncharacterized protein DICPUDRAFT_151185 [Dictyostelium purpureum]EGC36355.1 hypothetical protein DICPUDRAFT_151185 [Dictyostelium purpureum]|eukprot:XP_003287109.1 hypothetical protein DICPUDRAFT_151185 [Dictyostelium purpureum]